jgi:hypothetical protein
VGLSAAVGRGSSARVSYRDTEAATTKFIVQRNESAVKKNGKCVAPLRRRTTTKPRGCRLWVVVGTFVHRDVAGINRFHFPRRVKGSSFAPGRYRLEAVARLKGLASNRVRAAFRVRKS